MKGGGHKKQISTRSPSTEEPNDKENQGWGLSSQLKKTPEKQCGWGSSLRRL